MKKKSILIFIRKTFRNFNSINIILLAIVSFLSFMLVEDWSTPYESAPRIYNGSRGEEEAGSGEKNEPESLTLAYFEDIPAKNIFRPDRKEYLPPPPPPPPPPSPPKPPPPPPPKKKIPQPKLTLNGILAIEDNKDIALISGYYFTAKSRVNIKYQRFKEGDILGEYKIKEIKERTVLLIKDEDLLTLSLSFSGYKPSASPPKQKSSRGRKNRSRARKGANNRQNNKIGSGIGAGNRAGLPPSLPGLDIGIGGGSVEEIPAVYTGGRVYYPGQGAPPPPQNISGAITR